MKVKAKSKMIAMREAWSNQPILGASRRAQGKISSGWNQWLYFSSSPFASFASFLLFFLLLLVLYFGSFKITFAVKYFPFISEVLLDHCKRSNKILMIANFNQVVVKCEALWSVLILSEDWGNLHPNPVRLEALWSPLTVEGTRHTEVKNLPSDTHKKW